MQSLEATCEEGEVSSISCCQCNQTNSPTFSRANMVCTHSRAFKKAKAHRISLPLQPNQEQPVPTEIHSAAPSFCIHTKLRELHLEECETDPNFSTTGLKRNSHLLEKLVVRERLNTLVLNLYPGNKGYSISFPTAPNTEQLYMDDTAEMFESKQWPYEEEKLLRYIDNEELPAYFVDILASQYSFLFYSGCVIAEVRDYRQAYPHFKCDIHHVLLKPSLQSILADINMMDEKVDWGSEEKQQLESLIVLANNPKLCLNVSTSISEITSRLSHTRNLLNTHRLRRTARKYSQVSVNRKRKLDQFTHRPGMELFDFIVKQRTKQRNVGLHNAKMPKKIHDDVKPVPVPNLDPPLIGQPSQGVNINEFKEYQRPRETSDCLPQLMEEFVLETDMPSKDRGQPRVYHIKLSIFQRPSNSEYLGELYLDRDHKKGERNGSACRFSLGSRANANKYIHQFTEIFTEGGKKSVRINYGPGRDRVAQLHTSQMQSLHTPQVSLPQQQLSQLSETSQNQSPSAPQLVNGTLNSSITLIQGQGQSIPNASSIPILQTQLQANAQVKTAAQTSQEIEINALATKLMNSAQQFQAAANAKQQQQKMGVSGSNTAIINLLNSSPASNLNSDASAAVVNAINSTSILPQVQAINQKLLGRKITLSNLPNRVLNQNNLIAVNNNRVNLSDLNSHLGHQQGQTLTLTSMSNANFAHGNYTTMKQSVVNRVLSAGSSDGGKSTLSALLVGTPAADRPDIIGPNTNSLLLEKLVNTSSTNPNNPSQSPTHFIQSPKGTQQFTVQSPKNNSVLSPLSSPPPQSAGTLNVQNVNVMPLQNLTGLQNLQVQLPGFAQPISLSLNVSSAGAIQGHPASLIVSLPVSSSATTTCTSSTSQQTTTTIASPGNSIGTPTVVLTSAGTSSLAHIVPSGMKGQSIRTPVTLAHTGQPFQLVTSSQRPRTQQAGLQQNITARGIQRTPITIKMAATPNTNAAGQQTILPSSNRQLTLQGQTQVQFEQLYPPEQSLAPIIAAKLRRSNVSDSRPQ